MGFYIDLNDVHKPKGHTTSLILNKNTTDLRRWETCRELTKWTGKHDGLGMGSLGKAHGRRTKAKPNKNQKSLSDLVVLLTLMGGIHFPLS